MAWIKLHQTLINHPKLFKLAELLKKDTHQTCGVLVFLWSWALDYADDGDLSKYTEKQIYDAVRISSIVTPNLLQSLQEAGFVDENLMLHDWLDYSGEFLRGRYKTKQKKRKSPMKNRCGVSTEQVRSKYGATPPKSRVDKSRVEENREDNNKPPTPFKKEFDLSFIENVDFKDLFSKWLRYRKEIKKPFKSKMSVQSAYKNLLKLSNTDISVAKKIVEQSICRQWQGLFALKEDFKNKNNEVGYAKPVENKYPS